MGLVLCMGFQVGGLKGVCDLAKRLSEDDLGDMSSLDPIGKKQKDVCV